MQHDERLPSPVLEVLKQGDADIIVGSRYIDGAGVGQWDRRRAGCSGLPPV